MYQAQRKSEQSQIKNKKMKKPQYVEKNQKPTNEARSWKKFW